MYMNVGILEPECGGSDHVERCIILGELGMPGKLVEWPDWPEFDYQIGEHEDDLVKYKDIVH
jgi:hypothetical protein